VKEAKVQVLRMDGKGTKSKERGWRTFDTATSFKKERGTKEVLGINRAFYETWEVLVWETCACAWDCTFRNIY